LDDRSRDGGTNSTLRTKEQGTHLTLNEHDDDDDDDEVTLIAQGSVKIQGTKGGNKSKCIGKEKLCVVFKNCDFILRNIKWNF